MRYFTAYLVTVCLTTAGDRAAAGQESILVMEGTAPGRSRDGLAERMANSLRAAGKVLALGSKLGDAQKRCRDRGCLLTAGTQEGATWAISAWIDRETAARPLLVLIGCVMQEQRCENEEAELSTPNLSASKRDMAALEQTLERLLRTLSDPVPRYDAAGATSTEPRPTERRRPQWPLYLATVLGTLGTVTLVSSITLAALDQQATDGSCHRFQQDAGTACVWNFPVLYGPGFAATGLLLGGVGLSMGLSRR